MKQKLLAALAIILISATAWAGGEAQVDYPEGYRNWSHVKSMVILPGHPLENPFAGIHHVYANSKAAAGLKSGHYADGAVLVFDLLKATSGGKAITEGDRKLVGVMQRDATAWASTGGWGFEGFAGNSKVKRLTNDGGQGCFGCHLPQKSKSYVFSSARK